MSWRPSEEGFPGRIRQQLSATTKNKHKEDDERAVRFSNVGFNETAKRGLRGAVGTMV